MALCDAAAGASLRLMKKMILFLGLMAAAAGARAQDAREVDPYFVSLRSDEVNVRAGPGRTYPIEWVFRRRNLPLLVTAEVDNWRRVQDHEGDEGWIEQSLLSSRRTVMVFGTPLQDLYDEPDTGGEVIAQLEEGVTARLAEECSPDGWCTVDTSVGRGWMEARTLWGASAR